MTASEPPVGGRGLVTTAPELIFVFSALVRYWGAALAVGVFDRVDPAGVSWFRIAGAALVLIPWRRPWRTIWTRGRFVVVVALGAAIAAVNTVYYLAIAELPLGTTVAIELLGPIGVAAAHDRGRRTLMALALVVGGVYLLSDVQWEGSAVGVVWALAAAASWAGYIVLSTHVADDGLGVDGLAAASVAGLVVLAPVGLPAALPAFSSLPLLALCLAIGVLSSAIPQTLDQVVLARLPAGRFALLQSILPVTAAVVGFVVLAQVPGSVEAVGIALVVLGLMVTDRRS